MITKQELQDFINTLLQPETFQDFGPNGLQVDSDSDPYTAKISFAVSATYESIRAAVYANSDTLICHHGLFWNYQGAQTITGSFGKRIDELMKNSVNLLAYHLPLDANLTVEYYAENREFFIKFCEKLGFENDLSSI